MIIIRDLRAAAPASRSGFAGHRRRHTAGSNRTEPDAANIMRRMPCAWTIAELAVLFVSRPAPPDRLQPERCMLSSHEQSCRVMRQPADRSSVTPTTHAAVVQNKIDLECGSTTANAERGKQVAFSPLIFVAGTKLMVPKASTVSGPADLKGKTVVVTPCSAAEPIAATASIQPQQARTCGKIPITHAAPPTLTSRDFVPWRFSDAGRRSAWIASSCRHRSLHARAAAAA